MKFITCSSPILLALALAAQVARAQTSTNAATVERFSINNIGANAEFEWVDNSSCSSPGLLIHVSLQTGVSVAVQTGASTTKNTSPLTALAIVVFDDCNLTADFIVGATTDQTLTVDPNLKTATLDAVVPMLDETSNTIVYCAVHLVWSATASPTTTDHAVFHVPGFTVTYDEDGKVQPAVAVGSVTIGVSNYTPLPSIAGDIDRNGAVSVTIMY